MNLKKYGLSVEELAFCLGRRYATAHAWYYGHRQPKQMHEVQARIEAYLEAKKSLQAHPELKSLVADIWPESKKNSDP